MNIAYPNLTAEIAKRGIKKSAIASSLGISARALHNKITGAASFKWEEADAICERFFPDMTVSKLFAKAESEESDESA